MDAPQPGTSHGGPDDHTHSRGRLYYSPMREDPRIIVIGAGGIGSWAALALAKLGVHQLRVYDADRVEIHNIGTTPYQRSGIGVRKVDHLSTVLAGLDILPRKFEPIGRRVTLKTILPKGTDIVISAVDSLLVRKVIWDLVTTQQIPLLIDGRIGGESFRVYTIQPSDQEDRERYESTFVPQEQLQMIPCFAQQIIDVGLIMASLITRAVRQWVVYGMYTPEIVWEQAVFSGFVSEPRELEHAG